MRLLTFLAFLLFPISAQAACEGVDLRPQLPEETRARLQSAVAEIAYPEGNHWIARKGRYGFAHHRNATHLRSAHGGGH